MTESKKAESKDRIVYSLNYFASALKGFIKKENIRKKRDEIADLETIEKD